MTARLTDLIRHLPTGARIRAQRRVEAIADHWALYLRAKYGPEAAAVYRRKMIYCHDHARGTRWFIWCKVWRSLRPE